MKKILGIDIGGTKVACGLVVNNTIEKQIVVNITNTKAKDEIIYDIFDTVNKIFTSDIEGIGIGAPGLIDPENGILYQLNNIPSWTEVHLKQAFEKQYNTPTFVNNDANCFAVGEKYFGQGVGFNNLIGLTLGTGMGAGIIANGKLYSGVNCGAGEFGCIPYNNSILEHYCSGQFFTKHYGKTGTDLFELAMQNNTQAIQAFNQLGENIGNAIKIMLYTLAPQAIIIGGSVSNAYQLFESAMWQSVKQFPFNNVVNNLVIKKSELKNSAILGAAALCF